MELKPEVVATASKVTATFNRTSMELKPRPAAAQTPAAGLLIEPVWN